MTPLAATSGSSVVRIVAASRWTTTPALGPSAICAAASSTPASSSACSERCWRAPTPANGAQAIELQTAQVGPAPLLVGPRRHRERLVGLPGAQARLAAAAGLDACAGEGFDAFPGEPGLLRLHMRSCRSLTSAIVLMDMRSPISECASARHSCAPLVPMRRLPDRSFHLELDQPVQLDRVFQRQLLGDRLDEAVDDHAHRLVLGEAAALQVEDLLLATFETVASWPIETRSSSISM